MNNTITLYTMSYNGYWEKYGSQWCSYVNSLNTQPDEIIIVSDIRIDLSNLKHNNIKNIVSPVVLGRRMVSEYRNIAINAASSDWVVSADLDDIFLNVFLDDLPEDSDIHAFKFCNLKTKEIFFPDNNCLNERLYGISKTNLIPSCSAIKKHVFNILKYEDNCHEDRIFYAMASQLNLKVSSDTKEFPPRYLYNGWHTDDLELNRVTGIYIDTIINRGGPVYSFWFSKNMSENRSKALNTLSQSCKTLCFLDLNGFYQFENVEIPIHKGFQYLTDNHKSDYARAYMMYFYGGGYSDVKANNFDWASYFKILFSSKYDAVGYPEINPEDIPKFYNTLDIEEYVNVNYSHFIGNGHYIFKPKTYMAYQWLTKINEKMDERYEDLQNNPGKTIHIRDPQYKETLKYYPFEWNEIGGRILAKLQYENNLKNIFPIMPYVNNKAYL